jgi:HTH-type transcriptional regulator/antitoxin HigA
MHDIAPIRDEASHRQALLEIRRLWGSAPGTPDGDRLDVLMVLADAYEAEQHAIESPDPTEAIAAFVARDADIIAGIERGLDDMRAGRLVPHEEAIARLEATVATAERDAD